MKSSDSSVRESLPRRVIPPIVLTIAVASAAVIPTLSNRWFYYWDDSAAAFGPMWHTIGERLLAGSWPTLIPQMWAGGNVTAEALYGTYNPVLLADAAMIASIPNLGIGMTLLKMQFMAILAVGVYVLARQFGANKSMAFVAGFAMPFAGYTLYFDASSWASGLIAFAWTPHVWWSTRAAAMGRVNPLVAIVFGFLAMTTGNPYGAVAVAVVYLAVLIECLVLRDARRIGGLVWSGAAVLATSLIVYLPLAFTTEVSVRTQSGVSNDGFMRADAGELLNLSAPSNLPLVFAFGHDVMTVPLVFLAWFVIPLAPWIRWKSLKSLSRQSTSLIAFAVIYIVLLLGPSNLWLFRWPARLIEYGQMPVLIAFAVAASAGLARDRWRARALGSGGLIIAQFYLSWSNVPEDVGQHAFGLLLVGVLTAATVIFAFKRPRWVASTIVIGVVAVLGVQTNAWFTGNNSVTAWKFPRQVAFLKDSFENRYTGNTFVISDPSFAGGDDNTGLWGDLLYGNAWQPAGVDSINTYAGISYADFVNTLCINYYGGVKCQDAVARLQNYAPGTDVSWLDALRLETVVVQNSGPFGGPRAFDNLERSQWSVRNEGLVTVARRIGDVPWPDGRLSFATPGIRVESDSAATDTSESLTYSGSGSVTFALLAWPGWSATVDGKDTEVHATDGGLLQVDLPSGSTDVELQFTPPGTGLGRGLALLGLVLALVQAGWYVVAKRRTRTAAPIE